MKKAQSFTKHIYNKEKQLFRKAWEKTHSKSIWC
jgi:hypothetical protein